MKLLQLRDQRISILNLILKQGTYQPQRVVIILFIEFYIGRKHIKIHVIANPLLNLSNCGMNG